MAPEAMGWRLKWNHLRWKYSYSRQKRAALSSVEAQADAIEAIEAIGNLELAVGRRLWQASALKVNDGSLRRPAQGVIFASNSYVRYKVKCTPSYKWFVTMQIRQLNDPF